MSETIAVLGAGNMGTAVAQVLASNGHAVRAWSIETDVLEEMRDRRANTKDLSGGGLHSRLEGGLGLQTARRGSAVGLLRGASQIVAGLARGLKPFFPP